MSEVRLVVREAGHDWSGTLHGSSADRAIAALSTDPVTLAELEAACARFEQPRPNHRLFSNLSAGLCDEPYDAGLVVIDLVARLVVVDSTYSSPGSSGEVDYHDGQCATDTWLRYHLADDWLFTSDRFQWSDLADERRRERAAHPPLDARAILYGRPLIEFIAQETFAAHARRKTKASAAQDAIKEIHAAWLLTPRHDLGGVCPRDVALEQRDQLSRDLQDQAERWSLLQQCPPGLDEFSFAYRYGGFGTHELVQYYELVRELLWSCWDRFVELEKTQPITDGPESLMVGDFLTSEILRLECTRDEWLDAPDPECHGRTPRSIIDRERARLPEGMSGHDAIIDPDCPCCQMMADMPEPVFWHLDGCNMDDDFAFDIRHRTQDEWEAEQREWGEWDQRFKAKQAERERLGVADSGFGAEDENSVWPSSFSVGDAADVPLGIRVFGIGGHLAELIVDLRGEAAGSSAPLDAQPFIDQLNRNFGNLRELLQSSEPSLAATLLDPVIDRFAESLAAVASTRPDLSAKCESLTNSLARFVDPRSSEPSWNADDSESPF
ncbi:MAG: hypothetical protein Q8K78_08980 [Planctomycetaceae bacterium]|nr:hypothetical protein [Planctomycetaceae bacterium]